MKQLSSAANRRIILALCCTFVGMFLLIFQTYSRQQQALQTGQLSTITDPNQTIVMPASALTMDSTPFVYEKPWQVDAQGADPFEPEDPWQEPSGRLHFSYQGSELALLLGAGNYWGYLYVTVDGEPANLLPQLPNNHNSLGNEAGYRTFFAPEKTINGEPATEWIRVHQAADATAIHDVEVEIWRSWGQIPLRGVAVDTMPMPSWPRWPAALVFFLSFWLLFYHLPTGLKQFAASTWLRNQRHALSRLLQSPRMARIAFPLAIGGFLAVAVATASDQWQVALIGLSLLAWAGLQRPVLWLGAFLLGLPFYFSYTLPILPGRAIGLVDVGVVGGFLITVIHFFLKSSSWQTNPHHRTDTENKLEQLSWLLLAGIVAWSLVATLEASHIEVAGREWRTVFLYAGLFGSTLVLGRGFDTDHKSAEADQQLLVNAWLAGSTVVAIIALWQYGTETSLIQAEGVQRVRAYYGSPNNLALYVERTVAVVLALAFFTKQSPIRWVYLMIGLIQVAALLLTFSKGALLLALPAELIILWIGGWLLWRRHDGSRQPLWWLAIFALLIAMAIVPFLGTERFQRLLDLEEGTGFVRLQLWQSSWQMARDHSWFGVGPDNFLYAYRSYYLLPAAWQEPNLNHPHNWVLDWWTRLGLVGLALASGWFCTIAYRLWQAIWRGQAAVLALGILAAMAGALAHGLIDASYALPDLMVIWVLISVLPIGDNQETTTLR